MYVGNKGGERAHDSQREKEKMGVGIGPESYFSLHMILLLYLNHPVFIGVAKKLMRVVN